jgi:hypothetical protein
MAKHLFLVFPACLLLACSSATGSGTGDPCTPCKAPASAAMGISGPPRSAKVEQLARQRVDLARKRLVLLRAGFEHGKTGLEALLVGARDVAFAARDSGLRGEELRSILTEYRDAVVAMKGVTRERVSKGTADEEALNRVESLVAEAEFWLAEASSGT